MSSWLDADCAPLPAQVSLQLLQGMVQLASKNKANIERALQDFLQLAAQVTSCLPLNTYFLAVS